MTARVRLTDARPPSDWVAELVFAVELALIVLVFIALPVAAVLLGWS